MPAILLRIPYIQTKVSDVATTELSNYLGVPVRIGNVDFEWFNRLVLENLYLEDQDGKLMFEAKHVAAGVEVTPLLQGKFVFTTVRLFGFSVNLRKHSPESPLNLQFVIDAFARKDTIKKEKNIDLRFNSIMLRRGNFSFHIDSEKETPGKFNGKHIDVKNISAKIALRALKKDSINAHIKKLSLEETSGLSLEKLSLKVVANKDSAFIQDFNLELPQSNLKIGHASIDFTKIDSLPKILHSAPVGLTISPSKICLKDLRAFVPAFKNFTDTIELSAEANGFINDFNLKRLTLKYSQKMLLVGQMDLKNIIHPKEAYVFGKVSKMYLTTEGITSLANNFSKNPIQLPDPVHRLGTINFTGEISGFFDNLVAFGKVSSAIGSIETDLIFGRKREKNIDAYIQGRIGSQNLRLQELFPANNPLGDAHFDINIDAHKPTNGSFAGKVQAKINKFDFKSYHYENIQLAGSFTQNGFDGQIEVNDPNGQLFAQGLIQHQGKHSIFNFTARMDHFRPDRLNLTKKYENPEISFALNADFTGNTIDNANGSITLDSLSFKTTPSDFFLKKLEILASGEDSERQLTISSDLINGEVIGAYSFKTLVPSLMNTFKGYVPALINTTQKEQFVRENNFALLLTVENTEVLSKTLKLPITMIQPSRISGHYNNIYNKFRIEAWLPKFNAGKMMFESGWLVCDNPRDKVNFQLKATHYNTKGLKNYLDIKADAKEDLVNTVIGWANNKEKLFKADISTTTRFVEEKTEKGPSILRTEVALNKSPLIVKDTMWTIHPADITIREGKIGIQHFKIDRGAQHLAMDGVISPDPSDTLLLDLNKIELSYIFDILNIPVLQFGGEATGRFYVNDLFNTRMLNTDLEVKNFSFNQVTFGRLNLFSEWDDAQKGILMLGSIYKNDSTWTDVNGYVYPVGAHAGLSLFFDANDINLHFLQPFVDTVVKNIQGRGFGSVHLYGPFKKLNVEGDAYVMDGGIGVDFLDTYYTFSDSVHLDTASVNLRNVTVLDKFGKSGKVNLKFNHKHFKNYSFDVDIQASDLLMYDVNQKKNPLIYGTVFGSGTANIRGNAKLIDFDINMKSAPKTEVFLDFMNNTSATDYDFITFVDKKKEEAADTTKQATADNASAPTQGAEMRMNFLLDITPDADIELIMDPVAGDRIKGNASGSLQIQYGNRSDLRMYGDVNILEGNYNFSLQQIIHKDFKIRDGSSINFRGDPFNANMNVNAIYNLTANIGDLDQSLSEETGRTSVPVNCVLNLDGALRSPNISFDLEFPNSNEELERQVKAFVDTEDMMTRQIVYLLVLNKFYTPEYAKTSYRSGELNAVASSAISAQLSSILSSFTDKVQIGTNIRAGQDGFKQDTEYEMLLSSQLLDNRLLINGNFGMRNTINTGKNNTFIGEFDLEYKLTKSGDIRLKAYNHARDMYFGLKQALTIQGVGIMFRKDFTYFSEIFRRKKKRYPTLSPVFALPTDSVTKPASTDSIKLAQPIDKP